MTNHARLFHHGHAHKLDDPERNTWLPPDGVLAALALRPGMAVADIGCGTGYFALPLARAVAPGGRIFAVDLQPEMLERLRAAAHGEPSIELVAAEATRTTLVDASLDLVFLSSVWHELDDHGAALGEFARLLRPQGRLALVDWRPDAVSPHGPPLELRVAGADVVATLGRHGWREATEVPLGAYSYLVSARRPALRHD